MELSMSFRAHRFAGAALVAAALTAFAPQQASADALHGSCVLSTAACADNGQITPTPDTSPDFSFWKAGGSTPAAQQHFLMAVLIPNSVVGAGAESFTINGTYTGLSSVPSTLASSTAWTSGFLDSYLGIAAQPNNPIGAWLPLTQALQLAQPYAPLATGFYVYTLDFGTVTFGGTTNPIFTTAFDFPTGTVITAFSYSSVCTKYGKDGKCKKYESNWTATANSAALQITGNKTGVPEPMTLALLGAGLGGIGLMRRKRKAA
jgi:hypothetical protein